MTANISLYSDGGSDRGSDAASACIVESSLFSETFKVLAFLGDATNNEAEIFAGLVGFALLRSFAELEARQPLTWVCDSQYVLKSASGYIWKWQKNGWRTASGAGVKNQGLWRAYLELSRPFSITTEHVKGHSGHFENESCDSAVTWARKGGHRGLGSLDGLLDVDISSGDSWTFFDARPLLAAMRREDDTAAGSLVELLAPLCGSCDREVSPSDGALRPGNPPSSEAPLSGEVERFISELKSLKEGIARMERMSEILLAKLSS